MMFFQFLEFFIQISIEGNCLWNYTGRQWWDAGDKGERIYYSSIDEN